MIGLQLARNQFVVGDIRELGPDDGGLQVDEVRPDLVTVDEDLQAERQELGKTLLVPVALSEGDGRSVLVPLPRERCQN